MLRGAAQEWSRDEADLPLWIPLPDQDNLTLYAGYDPALLRPDPPIAVPLQVQVPAGTPQGFTICVGQQS